jgi:hypothetical protein
MPDASAQITVVRTSPKDVQNRQIYVKLDGEPMATLLFGRTATRALEPGEHSILADNTLRKKRLHFTIAAGEHAHFQVASTPGWGYNFMVGLFGAAPMDVSIERATAEDALPVDRPAA